MDLQVAKALVISKESLFARLIELFPSFPDVEVLKGHEGGPRKRIKFSC